jgi:hypothetical protein
MLGLTKFRAALPEWLEYGEHTAVQQDQADTVAHCGDLLSGHFADSLTLTGIYSA